MSKNKLDEEFQNLHNKINLEIQFRIKKAAQLIEEAVVISEKYGMPFRSEDKISKIGQIYIPNSLESKHPNINTNTITKICDVEFYDDEDILYRGWISSSDFC